MIVKGHKLIDMIISGVIGNNGKIKYVDYDIKRDNGTILKNGTTFRVSKWETGFCFMNNGEDKLISYEELCDYKLATKDFEILEEGKVKMNKQKIIENWYLYKNDLENYIASNKQEKYYKYIKLVKLVVKYILPEYDEEKIRVIQDGDYHGNQIFIIHKKGEYPSLEDYLYTTNYYGSCSGCDTIERIKCDEEPRNENGLPTENQVKGYMTLCLHLVQRLKPLDYYNEFEIEDSEEEI